MTKLPKFLLCENPKLTGDPSGRLFVLHNGSPRLLAEVHHYENIADQDLMQVQSKIEVGGRLDYPPETILFEAIWINQDDEFNRLSTQQKADQLAGVMRRMADWYKSYLIWESHQ